MNGRDTILYNHLLQCTRTESPSQLIDRFRSLFIEPCGYSDSDVRRALAEIVNSPTAEKEFRYVLNRSSHILVNHWLMHPRFHSAIPALVELFDLPVTGLARSRTVRRIQELRQQFVKTEQYASLTRLARMVCQAQEESAHKPLGNLIYRYPYLYEHSLLTSDTFEGQRYAIREIRRESQQQFEIKLSRFITHQRRISLGLFSRFSASNAALALGSDPDSRAKIQISVENPTLLSDRQLKAALWQFTGKIDGYNTHRDLAKQFLVYSSQTACYRTFKEELYRYLIASIDSSYGDRQFNRRLYHRLQTALVDYNHQPLNDVLLVNTCRRLLNFLVIESPRRLQHAVFADLTANLGITTTIGLLLKITLICSRIKPYLEKQFSVLFSHYENCTHDAVTWLVESLENLNVAFATNFGRMNLVYGG